MTTEYPLLDEVVRAVASTAEGIPSLRTFLVRAACTGQLTGCARSLDRQPSEELPTGWNVKPLGECVDILDAKRVPINEGERTRRIAGKPQHLLYPYYGATRQQGWIDDFIFDEELVLLGEDGVPFLDPLRHKAYLIRGKSWVNNHAHVLRGRGISNTFLCHALNVADYQSRVTGTTRLKLTQGQMVRVPIFVPPADEQARIVEALERLLGLVDDLEARLHERDSRAARLAAALASFGKRRDRPASATRGPQPVAEERRTRRRAG